MKHVMSATLRPVRSPLLVLIAVQHLHLPPIALPRMAAQDPNQRLLGEAS